MAPRERISFNIELGTVDHGDRNAIQQVNRRNASI